MIATLRGRLIAGPSTTATTPAAICLRDSNDQTGPILAVTRTTWTTFLAGLKDGQFDH